MKEFEIRDAVADDLNFILSSWLKSYRQSSQFAKHIPSRLYFEWHQKVIKRILERQTTRVRVAYTPEAPEVILGYFVAEEQGDIWVAHYLYVKKAFRRFGIAKELFNNVGYMEYTHMTDECRWILNKVLSLVYNPYRI